MSAEPVTLGAGGGLAAGDDLARRGVIPDSGARRAVDIAAAVLGGGVLMPVASVAALAIRFDSPGPVLYRQLRVGRDGRPFMMLKLRTMVRDADRSGTAVAGTCDPRVTRVGRALRATKLDEVPQLWNILRGDMTLVGPRAEVPELIERYGDAERRLMNVLLTVRPGLTGAGGLHFTVHQADVLDTVEDPASYHIEHQLADKLGLELAHLQRRGWRADLALVGRTALVALGLRWSWLAPTLPGGAGGAGGAGGWDATSTGAGARTPDGIAVIDVRDAAELAVPTPAR